MRRILLLITDLEIGGTPTVVRELATRLTVPDEVRVDVACLKISGPVATQLEARGIFVHVFSATSPFDFPPVVAELRALVREREIDTVLSFLVHANVVAASASRVTPGVRWLQSIQTSQPNPRWHWVAQRVAHHAAEKVIVPSPSVAGVAERWADVPLEKSVVIPNAVEIPDPQPARAPRDDSIVRVGFVGRLDPVKRLPDLIEAVSLLPPHYHLDVVGEGSDRRRVEKSIARFGVQDRVTLRGASALVDMSRFDVLVLPSEAEGFGLVLIEAMAAGVPVVATNADGIRDVVRHEHNGLLVPVGSPPAIRDAIERVMRDGGLRRRLVDGGRDAVASQYSWPAVLGQYREVLRIGHPMT
jgi:glycosyltransferase involved in cell wall biosynthesis